MHQTFIITINNKTKYVVMPEIGKTLSFDGNGNIIKSYLKKTSKNNYEIFVAYKDTFLSEQKIKSFGEALNRLKAYYKNKI